MCVGWTIGGLEWAEAQVHLPLVQAAVSFLGYLTCSMEKTLRGKCISHRRFSRQEVVAGERAGSTSEVVERNRVFYHHFELGQSY